MSNTEDRKVQIVAEVDATPARTGFEEVKASARDMAVTVNNAGKQAGEGVKQISEGADPAAQKLDRATKSVVASIQRTTAALQAGGQSNSQYFESIAQQRGVNVDVLRPYLKGLDDAAAKQATLNTSMQSGAMSAAQMNAALRGVPAQFTDIVTSIASGQQPLTVFLQQGGQLKDMFGSAGGAARALNGYVAGLINPFTLAAGGAAALAVAYYQGSKEADAYARALIMTGNAAGTSAAQLQDMAKAAAAAAGTTQGAAAEAVAAAAGTGKVAAANIELVSQAAIKLNRAVGASIQDTIADFAELGNEPVKASEKLNDKYNYLTASVYEQIRALEQQGKTLEAATLAQRTYADAMSGRADTVVANLGAIELAWQRIIGTAKIGWDAIAGIGRQQNDLDRIAELRQKMAPGRGIFAGISDAEKQELSILQAKVKNEADFAAAKAESNHQEQARIGLIKAADEYASKQQKKQQEITRLQQLYSDAVKGGTLSTAEIVAETKRLNVALAGVEEKYKEAEKRQPRTGKSQEVKDAEELERILNRINGKATGLDASYYTDLQTLFKGYTAGKLSIDDYRKAVENLTTSQAFHTDAVKAETKAREEAQKAQADYFNNWQKYLLGLDQEADRLEDQANLYGLGKGALAQLALARAEDTLQKARDNGVTDEYLTKLEQEVELRKRIAAATANVEAQEANTKAAERAQQEWQRVSEDIGRGLTDAIFNGGKDGWELLKKTIEATVIRAVVQPMVTQGVQSSLQAIGLVTSGAGASNPLGTFGSLTSAGAGLSSLFGGASAYTGAAGFLQLGSMASGFSTGLGAAAAGADLSAAIAAYEAAGMTATAGSLGAGVGAAGMLGSSAGLVSSALGSVMAAAPYLAGALFIADKLGAFKGATYHKGGAYLADTSGKTTQATASNFSDFALTWGAYRSDRSAGYDDATKALSLGVATQLASSIASYGGTSKKLTVGTRFASDNDDWSEGAIRILDQAGNRVFDFTKRYTRNASKAMEEFAADTTRALVGALAATDLSDEFDALFDTINPLTASLEDLNTVMTKAATVSQIMGVLTANTLDAAAMRGAGALDLFHQSSDALRDMAKQGSLSLDDMLTYAKSYYDTQVNLLSALNDAGRGITETIQGSIRNLQYGLLDAEGQYSMLDREAARYMDVLRTLTDPTQITAYAGKLNETLNTAFALIPAGLREGEAQAFIDRFQQVESLAQNRIEAARQQALDDQQSMANTISSAIITAFGGVAPAIENAAKTIPRTISVTVQAASGLRTQAEIGY